MNNTPIFSANALDLSQLQGNLSQMGGTLRNWFQVITFIKLTKSIVNNQNVETSVETSFEGVRQPFTPQQLQMKPEGQRAWKWETIHAVPSLVLTTDDQMNFNGQVYRVNSKSDFKEYGYVMYEIYQDFDNGA